MSNKKTVLHRRTPSHSGIAGDPVVASRAEFCSEDEREKNSLARSIPNIAAEQETTSLSPPSRFKKTPELGRKYSEESKISLRGMFEGLMSSKCSFSLVSIATFIAANRRFSAKEIRDFSPYGLRALGARKLRSFFRRFPGTSDIHVVRPNCIIF